MRWVQPKVGRCLPSMPFTRKSRGFSVNRGRQGARQTGVLGVNMSYIDLCRLRQRPGARDGVSTLMSLFGRQTNVSEGVVSCIHDPGMTQSLESNRSLLD